jgi:hypothetical protein
MLENTEGAIMKKYKPEKLATEDTQETEQINVREYRQFLWIVLFYCPFGIL